MKDLKILNAEFPVFDKDSFETADILIEDGVITKIGTVTDDTDETIDAEGKIVSPGFVDMHAHEDPVDTGEFDFFTPTCELRQGVTTKIAGNCGGTADSLEVFYNYVKEKGSPVNYMMFVGQNTLRERVGITDVYHKSTRAEIDKMKKLIEEHEKFSPLGLSCGFEYSPGVTTEETIELVNTFRDKGHLVSVHFRADGDKSVDSINEMAEIQKGTGCIMQMSHIGSSSAIGYMREALDCVKRHRDAGIDMEVDCYPYNAFCTGIGTAVFDGDALAKWHKGYDALLVTAGKYKGQRCTKEMFDWLRKDEPDTNVVAFVMNDDEIDMAYREPFVMVGSDCGYDLGCGHPRGAGTYPRILGNYVRERGVMTLIEALRKMTIQPAARTGLTTKGEIKEGYDADIVIFDPETVIDKADFDNPALPPEGIEYVILNGKIAVKNNNIVNGRLGTYIPYKIK